MKLYTGRMAEPMNEQAYTFTKMDVQEMENNRADIYLKYLKKAPGGI
ncbi:MAG: hypothetical protein OIN66_15515 [Candidatus Methanoperedens sp.]|nr:hypothetical protein [Candidatus Methanoperedens sp.]